jgi:hypothetical protein
MYHEAVHPALYRKITYNINKIPDCVEPMGDIVPDDTWHNKYRSYGRHLLFAPAE